MNHQSKRVLEYMKEHETLEPMEAWSVLGVYRLAARVNELRKEGVQIETDRVRYTNKFGEKVSYAKYTLISPTPSLSHTNDRHQALASQTVE